MGMQPTNALLEAMLTSLGTDSTTLGNTSIGLARAAFVPSVTLTLSNITEANFNGYTRKSHGAWAGPFVGSDGLVELLGNLLDFAPSDTVTANTIFGWFMTGSDSTKLVAAELFDAPVQLLGPTNYVAIAPKVALDPTGNFGVAVVTH